ncbi:hypothetical protein Gpo141_00005127 [Globisporangium polare]
MSTLKAASAAITYLPFASLKKKKKPKSEQQLSVPSTSTSTSSLSAQLQAKLSQLRAKRTRTFFQKRAEQRELVTRVRGNPVVLITHKLSKIVSLFSKSNRPALKAKIRAFFSRDGLAKGVKGLLGAIRNAIKRLRGPSAAELLLRELERLKKKEWRQRYLSHLFHALAIQGRNLLRGKHKRLRREQITLFVPGYVANELLGGDQVARVAKLIWAKREAAKLLRTTLLVQRAWRQLRRKQVLAQESKQRLLGLLTTMKGVLKQQDEDNMFREDVLKRTCEQANARILQGATRRLAVRLIQRVWRGYRARLRVFQICALRRKKEMQKLQRERLRKAREALLNPSSKELQQVRAKNTRIQTRKERTPLILPPGFSQRQPHMLTHERMTLLEPLPMQHTPPKISSLTRAKTQRVPFAKFEKICAQHARVNPQNLWVAIPVGFGARAAGLPEGSNGSKTKKRGRFFAVQYDWVPATLLQHEQL